MNLHTTLLHLQMQQQYFKTMNQTNFSCKKINSTKPINNTAKNNFNSHNSFRDIEFTDQQASYVKARLPAEFWLIKPNTDQLQKAKEEARTRYLSTKSSLEKFQAMKSKKTVKKIQERANQINQTHNQKVSSRQIEKVLEPEKQKKIKKQHHFKKRVLHKINDKKDQNHEQMESESERSQQQFHLNELKTIRQVKQEFAERNRKKKQKQKEKQKEKQKQKQFDDKDKLKEKEKKTLKPNKELIKDANLERLQIIENFQQNLATNQVNLLVKESTKSQKNCYASPSFPTLLSGLPRHIPLPNDQPEGTVQSNNLRFLFGLPYFGGMSQHIRKLSQKQKNFCTNIIQKLKAHRSSQAFRVPVDPQVQGVPDYYYVVYNPMDLGSISKKLLKDKYQDICEFHSDINLIFHNSYKYNLRSTKYFEAAVEFQDYYQTLLKQAEDKPEQYARQYIPKQLKPKVDTGQLDYTELTPFKKKKKRQLEQIRNMQGYMTNKYEFIESRRMRGKSKSAADEHSALYTHSMVLQTVNQFHGQMEMENQTKNYPNFNAFGIQKQKCSESEIPRVKKMESMKISGPSEQIIREIKEQNKQKYKAQQISRNTFGKIQNDTLNPNLKNASTSFQTIPIAYSQVPSILEKVSDHQIIEQKQVQTNKNNKNSINMVPKKSINKAQRNKGKRNMIEVMDDGQENKLVQEKRCSNTQQKVVNEEKQNVQMMEQQEIEQKKANGKQQENMKMNKVQQQNIQQFAYGHFMNQHQGYNYYYNQMHNPAHYNNYLMLDRRNIGSDDDYEQIGANHNNYINEMDYENIYPNYGAYYEKFQPYQFPNIQMPNHTLQPPAKFQPYPTVLQQQEIKQELGKKKKRNIIKFPPRQNQFTSLPFKQQISQLKQSKNEQKQKKLEKQQKLTFKEGINKKQIEKNIVEFQPLEGLNQFNVECQIEKSNVNLNKKEKKKQDELYNPKNTPYSNFGYKKMKNSHENITINNINQHPPVYSQKHQSGNSNQNIDINMIIYQNTEHQNYSGSTVASNIPVPSRHPDQNQFTYPQITKKQTSSLNNNSTDNLNSDNINLNKVKSKKSKKKKDQQYQCSSDDQQYNMEEQWKLIRKNQNRQPTRKFKPKIHKQKSKVNREHHRRGRYAKPSIFDQNILNLSNTEQTKNVHQNQTNQNSNKQYVQVLAGGKDLQKIVKFQEETIPKNIFIESEHESSHFSKRELNLQDYMGQLMNHQEDMIEHSKEILDYSVNDRKQSKLLRDENIYQDEYSQEKQGQSLDIRGQFGDMEAELKQIHED